MRLKAFSPTADCSHHHASFQAFAPSVPSSFFTSLSSSSPSSSFRLRNPEMDSSSVSVVVLSNPFASRTLLKSRSFNKISRGGAIRRSCSLNLDGVLREEPSFHVEGSAIKMSNTRKEDEGRGKTRKKRHCAISNSSSPFLGGRQQGKDMQDSFLNSSFDFLEPMMLGIRPEELPDRETAAWATIERKANSFDIPISLRMIKKKLQWEEGFAGAKEESYSGSEEGYCSVKAAFASMVFIIVELQSCALHMREALCHEDLEIITSKVQKEMHYSFVWLFKHVFSRTPTLMLHVMILLANFSVHSASYNHAIGGENALFMEPSMNALSAEQSRADSAQQNQQINSLLSVEEKTTEARNLQESVEHPIIYPSDEFVSVEEMNLWNSMVDDAAKMREGNEDGALDHDTMQHLVSPVSVELEPDRYRDYLRTDLLYQMNLSQEPDNPLLLCNYAQFLHLVAHDYHRSEECFKRAVQLTPPDAESLSRYAHFLWTVRKDYWAAEESFLQALALEPGNTYYASRYANFLWSTGGEETCFPLNNSHNPNV